MFSRHNKTGYLILEGLNSLAIVFHFYYLYFFMQKVFGFENRHNLVLAASTGAINMLVSWWGGRFAQRFGYLTALKLGFFIMLVALSAETQVHVLRSYLFLTGAVVIGMSFTWPALEALVSDGETPESVKHFVGVYNIV